MPFADLHIHSTSSDGVLTPFEIVARAAKLETLHALAITDHDSLDAVHIGMQESARNKLDFVVGVEITTRYDARNVHMLGYFVDPDNRALNEFFEENRQRRTQRTYRMAELLQADGFSISPQDLYDTHEVVNRLLLARLLVKQGCARDTEDAFTRLVGQQTDYYVDVDYPDSIETIGLIAEAGGFAFIAHPAQYHVVDLVDTFAKAGMTGLEAYHTMQTPRQSAQLVQLACDLGLAVSGGSDWHGDATHGACLGACGLDEEAYRAFCAACER